MPRAAVTRWQGMMIGMGLAAFAPPMLRGEPPAMAAMAA